MKLAAKIATVLAVLGLASPVLASSTAPASKAPGPVHAATPAKARARQAGKVAKTDAQKPESRSAGAKGRGKNASRPAEVGTSTVAPAPTAK